MLQRYLLLAVLGLILSTSAYSQKQGQEKLDSLLAELPKAKEDTNKVKLLKSISWEYHEINPDEGIKYGEQGLALAVKLSFKRGQAGMLSNLGGNNNAKANYRKALELHADALRIDEEINNKEGVAADLVNMANVYQNMGDYVQTLESQLKALKIHEELEDKPGTAIVLANIGLTYRHLEQESKALEYFNRALKIDEETGDKNGIAIDLGSIGGVYLEQGKYEAALDMYRRSLKMHESQGSKHGALTATGNMGIVYVEQKKYKEAISHFIKAMDLAEEIGDKRSFAVAVANTGELYLAMVKDSSSNNEGYGRASNMAPDNLRKAVLYLNKAVEMYKFIGATGSLPKTYASLSEAYKLSGNYKASLEAHEQYSIYKDSVFNKENTEKITRLEVEGEYQRKQLADSLKNLETKKLAAAKLQRQRNYTYVGMGGVLLLLGFSFFIVKERGKSEKARKLSDVLLLNILPEEVSNELKDRGATTAKHFDEVTVLFTDFVNFTGAGERMGTQKLVEELHTCFKAFDEIIGRHNIEKIKTIGDAYLAVSGLPVLDTNHADNVMKAAMEIRAFMLARRQELGNDSFEVRVGIHTGPVVAGIVGVKKFAYDIWGDTVNTAARMEQKSEAGKINISQSTYEIVKDKYTCTYRGEIEAKNKGMMKMYYVEGFLSRSVPAGASVTGGHLSKKSSKA